MNKYDHLKLDQLLMSFEEIYDILVDEGDRAMAFAHGEGGRKGVWAVG
jgi:hypothetical protein